MQRKRSRERTTTRNCSCPDMQRSWCRPRMPLTTPSLSPGILFSIHSNSMYAYRLRQCYHHRHRSHLELSGNANAIPKDYLLVTFIRIRMIVRIPLSLFSLSHSPHPKSLPRLLISSRLSTRYIPDSNNNLSSAWSTTHFLLLVHPRLSTKWFWCSPH